MATATASPLQLAPNDLRFYRDEGYLLVRGLVPPGEMAAARAELQRVDDAESRWPDDHQHVIDPSVLRHPSGSTLVGGLQLPAKRSEDFARIADHPNLRAAMAQILGGPVKRFTDQAGIKSRHIATEQGGRTFFHQDSQYWGIDPNRGCNCWVPFDEVGKDAIALAVMPRSHLGWKLDEHEQYYDDPPYMGGRATKPFQRHRIPLSRVDFSKEVLIPMRPGDGLFFTNYTWHRSEPNRTGKTLCFYAIAYEVA